jgi:hypothetical protein
MVRKVEDEVRDLVRATPGASYTPGTVTDALARLRLGAAPATHLRRGLRRALPAMERAGLVQRLQGGSSAHSMADAYELTPAGTAALARVRR